MHTEWTVSELDENLTLGIGVRIPKGQAVLLIALGFHFCFLDLVHLATKRPQQPENV